MIVFHRFQEFFVPFSGENEASGTKRVQVRAQLRRRVSSSVLFRVSSGTFFFLNGVNDRYGTTVVEGISGRSPNSGNDLDTRPTGFVHVFLSVLSAFGKLDFNEIIRDAIHGKTFRMTTMTRWRLAALRFVWGKNRHASGTLLFNICIIHTAHVTVKYVTFTLTLINNNE